MALRSQAELVTTAEAADLAGVPVRTIQRWVKEGRLEALTVNPRLMLLKRADVLKLKRPERGRPKKPKP